MGKWYLWSLINLTGGNSKNKTDMIKFSLICTFFIITNVLYSQGDSSCYNAKRHLAAFEYVVKNKKFEKILIEYKSIDTVFIQRDIRLFPADEILDQLVPGKTICLFSNEEMFLYNIRYWLRIIIIKCGQKTVIQVKTCSSGVINDLNYYIGKIIFRTNKKSWELHKYRLRKYKPTGENVKWNELYPKSVPEPEL
jgi:hypothetical protein